MDNPIGTLHSAVPNPTIASSSLLATQGQESSLSVQDSIHNPQVPNDKMDLETPETVNKPSHIPRNTNIPGSNWVTVTKKKGYPVVLPVEALGDALLDEKKSAAYRFLLSINREFTSFQAKKINGVDVIGASFYSEDDALLACANPLTADTPNAKFTPLAEFNKDKNSVPTFYVAIYDVPLNVDKLLFKTHMEQYGPIKSINYSLSKLHYTVHITYTSRDVAPKLVNLWSIQFNKDAFRIWPDTLKN